MQVKLLLSIVFEENGVISDELPTLDEDIAKDEDRDWHPDFEIVPLSINGQVNIICGTLNAMKANSLVHRGRVKKFLAQRGLSV